MGFARCYLANKEDEVKEKKQGVEVRGGWEKPQKSGRDTDFPSGEVMFKS